MGDGALGKFFARIADAVSDGFFWIAWLLGRVFCRLYFRLTFENVPNLRGAFVIAGNHTSLLDGFLVQMAMRRRVSFFLTINFYRLRALNWLFRWIHAIPVYDGGGNKNALFEATERLQRGEVVGIFPEGGIAADGKMQKPRPGVAIIAEAAQVPVVPVAIVGAFESMPRGSFFPKPRRIHLRFGDPIPPLERSEAPRRERYRGFAESLMSRIAALGEKKSS